MSSRASLSLLTAACAALGACAQGGGYPSLAARPDELSGPCAVEQPEAPAPIPVVTPDDPALAAELDRLRQQVRQGHDAFESQLEQARAAVQRAGPPGSESWIDAQVAVSAVEAARAPTVSAVADLDSLAKARSAVPTSEADSAAIAAALAGASQIADRQTAEINRLTSALPSG